MTPPSWSMSSRLILRLTASLCALWLGAVGLASLTVRHEMNEVFDSVLQEAAQMLLPDLLTTQAALLERGPGTGLAPALPAVPHDEYLTYQLMSAAGEILLRSHGAPPAPYLLAVRAGHATSPDGRAVYTEISVDGRYAILVAEPAKHRSGAIFEAIMMLLLPLLGLVPVAALLIRRCVQASMAPLRILQSEIRERSRINTTPIDAQHLPQELVPIRHDVNQLLQGLGLALESERNFAANAAHELRTPLAAALAQAHLLREQLGPETADGRRAQLISSQMQRLARRMDKLLQLARADAGVAMQNSNLPIASLLGLVCDEFRHRLGRRLCLELEAPKGLTVPGDQDSIGIVLRNLIENAALHGDPAQPITVRLAADGSIDVSNAAEVVPAPILATLARPFQRYASEADGSGLGLSIVAAIMRQSGGRLELHSNLPGRFIAVLRFAH